MKRFALLMVIVFCISGCDNAKQSVETQPIKRPMTLVISPGYKVKVGGRIVSITGSEDCSVSNNDVVNLGGAASAESRSCIVIKPTTQKVAVLIGSPDGPLHENWTVVRSGNNAVFQRADGSYVESVN